jgi:radical SAM protein with 4Fe4S-binding SPASM domain
MKTPLRSPEKVYGLHFTHDEIRAAVEDSRLLTLDLETGRRCNLKCLYCYSDAGRRMENELSLAEIKDVIDQAVALGVQAITIIGGGEPLMAPYILDMIDYLSQKSVNINLFTNATLLTPLKARFLADRKVSVVTKFNSMRAEVQDELAGVPGSYDRIQAGIRMLLDAGYGSTPELPLGLETIICRQNYHELEAMWRYARDHNFHPYFEVITFQGRAKREKLNVETHEIETLFHRLLEIDEQEYGYTWVPRPPIAGLTCARHYYNLLVTSNGFVHPCTGVDVNVGNVRHETLAEIIQTSPVIKSLRHIDQHIKGKCRTCRHNPECYGCRGFAYHFCGDFLAADPTCWVNEPRKARPL